MRELEDAARLRRDGRKMLEDERTLKGIAGFPGIEERFTSILEKTAASFGGSTSPQVRSILYTGFLGGVSMMISVIRELQDDQPMYSARKKIMEGIVAELDLCYREVEIDTVRSFLRSDGDEG